MADSKVPEDFKVPAAEQPATASIGDDFQGLCLADVIPRDRPPWYADTHLWRLNLLLLCGLLTQTATGFDASMLNGMQSLPQVRFPLRSFSILLLTFGPSGLSSLASPPAPASAP